jgi:hypothetical protein
VPGAPDAAGGSAPVARPSQLLRPETRTARFRSRAAELERLTDRCAGDGLQTCLVSGPAGLGKTRLALELADRPAATGEWEVEFLVRDADLPVSGPRPLLVVVDDAETRQEQVARVIRAADPGPPAGKVRVLMLVRTRDEWPDRLGARCLPPRSSGA